MSRYTLEERKALAKAELIKATKRTADKKARPRQVRPTAKGQRQPRERNPAFLAWLRRLPCVAGAVIGGCEGPVQAAHLRYSDASTGRISPGLQSKPSDRFATSLCAHHHLHDQHLTAERLFWQRLNIEPGELAAALYEAFNNDQPGEPVIRSFAGKAVSK
jgi:hypothetical protein